MPEQVTREYIETITKEKRLLGSNAHAAALVKIVASSKVLGNRAGTQQGLASIIYSDAPTINNRSTVNDRNPADTRNYGDTRLANLCRGKASFSPREAEWIHLAFSELFGAEWGSKFEASKIVTANPSLLIQEGLAQMLPWPDDLSAFSVAQLLISSSGPVLRLIDAEKLYMMGQQRPRGEALLTIAEDLPSYSFGQQLWLEVAQVASSHQAGFFFALSQSPICQGNQRWLGMGIAVHELDAKAPQLLGTHEGKPLQVYDVEGQFLIGVISAIDHAMLENIKGTLPISGFWTEEACRNFINRLRKSLQHSDNKVGFRCLTYRSC